MMMMEIIVNAVVDVDADDEEYDNIMMSMNVYVVVDNDDFCCYRCISFKC